MTKGLTFFRPIIPLAITAICASLIPLNSESLNPFAFVSLLSLLLILVVIAKSLPRPLRVLAYCSLFYIAAALLASFRFAPPAENFCAQLADLENKVVISGRILEEVEKKPSKSGKGYSTTTWLEITSIEHDGHACSVVPGRLRCWLPLNDITLPRRGELWQWRARDW